MNQEHKYTPLRSVDQEMQALDQQEGCSWMEEVTQGINEEAEGVCLSSPLRRPDQSNSTDEQRPSIFLPRQHQVVDAVAPPRPIVARTPSLAASNNRGSTGGNVIVTAVGPYHHQSDQVPPPLITPAKKCAIVRFLARREFGLDTNAFLQWALENDVRARGYYEPGSFTMTPEELARMLLIDGCLVLFAIFLLSRSSVREVDPRWPTEAAKEFTDLSADISLNTKQTRLDLLLLGNQIPFFVLVELHSKLEHTLFGGIKLEALALSCFEDIRPSPSPNPSPNPNPSPSPNHLSTSTVVHHLLHLFHLFRVPRGSPSPSHLSTSTVVHHLLHLFHSSRVPRGNHAVDTSKMLRGEPESSLPCATWFEDSLISFSKHAAAQGTLQIAFQRSMLGARGVLRVPALHIHGYSELVFRNLIAFEQSYLRCGVDATTYVICMARLLQSEADAKMLRNSGILAHTHETDREIVDLFGGLADEYCRDAFCSPDLLGLCKEVEAHHHSKAARAVKWVVVQCFPKQTVTFFVILGALISIATFINTIVSVYRFYHPAIKVYVNRVD